MTAQRLTKRQRQRRDSFHAFFQRFKCIECGAAGSDMRADDAPENIHLRYCKCGTLYNVSIGRPPFPDTFSAYSDFTLGRHQWHMTYHSSRDETDFFRTTDGDLREHEHRGYLSPRHFRNFFAFL